jgi:FSR family fosmidomycin resistance protein-like MFS transporter
MLKRGADDVAYASSEAVQAADIGAQRVSASLINWRLLSLAWAHFLNDGAANFLPGVLPAILIALNIELKLVGTVMAALLVCQALQPACGWLADRFGGRAFVIMGVGGSACGGALIGLAPGYYSLLGVLFIVGAANSLFHPQAMACVRQVSVRRFGLSMSVFLVGGELGRAFWPLVASVVASRMGLRALWVLAIPTVATLPLIVRELPRLKRRAERDTAGAVQRRWNSPALIALVVYCSLHATLLYSLTTFLPLLYKLQGSSLVGAATSVTVLLSVGNLGSIGGGYLADHVGRRTLLAASAVLSATLLTAFLVESGAIRWFLLGALGLVAFSTMPLRILIAQDILPDNHSLGSGLALGFSNAVGAVAIAGLGPVAARWGVSSALWLSVGAAALLLASVPFLADDSVSDVT